MDGCPEKASRGEAMKMNNQTVVVVVVVLLAVLAAIPSPTEGCGKIELRARLERLAEESAAAHWPKGDVEMKEQDELIEALWWMVQKFANDSDCEDSNPCGNCAMCNAVGLLDRLAEKDWRTLKRPPRGRR